MSYFSLNCAPKRANGCGLPHVCRGWVFLIVLGVCSGILRLVSHRKGSKSLTIKCLF